MGRPASPVLFPFSKFWTWKKWKEALYHGILNNVHPLELFLTIRDRYFAISTTISETMILIFYFLPFQSPDSPNCYLAVLTIQNLSSEDGGEYMFVVRNSKGIHDGTILLNITQASYSVSSVSTSASRAYSLRFSPHYLIVPISLLVTQKCPFVWNWPIFLNIFSLFPLLLRHFLVKLFLSGSPALNLCQEA